MLAWKPLIAMEGGIMKFSPRTFRLYFYSIFTICLILSPSIASGSRSDVEAFVTRFYQQCLEREPEQTGLIAWTNALLDGSLSGADIANGLTLLAQNENASIAICNCLSNKDNIIIQGGIINETRN